MEICIIAYFVDEIIELIFMLYNKYLDHTERYNNSIEGGGRLVFINLLQFRLTRGSARFWSNASSLRLKTEHGSNIIYLIDTHRIVYTASSV